MWVPRMLSRVIFQYATPGRPPSAASSLGLSATFAISLSLACQNASKSAGGGAAGIILSGAATAPPPARLALFSGFHRTSTRIVLGASTVVSSVATLLRTPSSPRPTSLSPPLLRVYRAAGALPAPLHS